MNKKLFLISMVLFMMISLCACSTKQTEDIFVLYTNDTAGELNGNISFSNIKGYKDLLESEDKGVCLVDAGDFLDGSISYRSKGQDIVKIMNLVGYDAVAMGNQEFSIGVDALKECIEKSDFDYLSCNMRFTGLNEEPLKAVKPYVIKKIKGTKIAFIGVTTPDVLISGKPSYEALIENGELIYDFYEGNKGADLYKQVQSVVDEASKKADYVIVLSHLGSNSTRDGFSSYELIANTNGIDALIDGHSHTVIEGETVFNKDGNIVLLTSTGEKLSHLGIMKLSPDHTCTSGLLTSIEEANAEVDQLVDSLIR